jgi:hypothetical protein
VEVDWPFEMQLRAGIVNSNMRLVWFKLYSRRGECSGASRVFGAG